MGRGRRGEARTRIAIASGGGGVGLLLALAALATPAAALEAELYFPVEPGQYSTFETGSGATVTSSVLETTQQVGGVETLVLETTGGEFTGGQTNVTLDDQGARMHRVVVPDVPIDGLGTPDVEAVMVPPALSVPEEFFVGEEFETSGTAYVTPLGFDPSPTITVEYVSVYEVLGEEPIAVPYGGPYDAVHFRETLQLTQPSTGETIETITDIWRAPGLGPLKGETSEGGVTEIRELVETNRTFLPEPGGGALAAAALGSLVLLGHRRSGARPS